MVQIFYKSVCICPEHTGEAGVSGEEHAGSAAFGSFYHCETRSLVYRAVDRRICLPEPRQVRHLLKFDSSDNLTYKSILWSKVPQLFCLSSLTFSPISIVKACSHQGRKLQLKFLLLVLFIGKSNTPKL